jgi:hypothetical protein
LRAQFLRKKDQTLKNEISKSNLILRFQLFFFHIASNIHRLTTGYSARSFELNQKPEIFEAIFISVESQNGMNKNELRRIIVSAKRHNLYQLFWVALFFPIAITSLIMSYIIYRKDIPMKLKPFMKWLKASD